MDDDFESGFGEVAAAVAASLDLSDEDDSPSGAWRGEGDGATGSDLFSAALRKLFAETPGEKADKARRIFLRGLVERDGWFVPTRPDGSWRMITVEPGKYRRMVEREDSGNGGKRKRRDGAGGNLLPVYATQPEVPAIALDGRALARGIPAEAAGLLLHFPERAPRELGSEFFEELRRLADACDLEAMLVSPGPEDAETLLRATWWVDVAQGEPVVDMTLERNRVFSVHTFPDTPGPGIRPTIPMEGSRLFRLLVEREDVDGIVINRLRSIRHGQESVNGAAFAPGFACRILEGDDCRPGVRPLPAHSREEVTLWLNFRRFPGEGREWVETRDDDGVRVRVRTTLGSAWRMQETVSPCLPRPGPTESPVFRLPPDAPAAGFAPTASRILCPGLLARTLNAAAPDGANAGTYWRVGRWLVLGRYVSASERSLSEKRLTLARELAKFLPPNADRIPRSAVRTVEGATVFREYPHAASRAWIETTLDRAERYTHAWVWGG